MPEALAIPQLGRLRELMLREAQLLGSLSHDCLVPLESGWLEQRTGAEPIGEWFYREPSSEEPSGRDLGAKTAGSSLTEAHPTVISRQTSAFSGRTTACCRAWSSPLKGCARLRCQDAVNYVLRFCAPLTVFENDDDASEDRALRVSSSGIVGDRNACESVPPPSHLSWGGDGMTHWRGAAEPKETLSGEDVEFTSDATLASFTTAPFSCEQRRALEWAQQRSIRLTSYLLLPDWLPLRLWFDTEFKPSTAGNRARVIDAAITAPEDWVCVWRHLLTMFLQVVRGVEFLHTQGIVHNNLHPGSVWVGPDGKCHVGNVRQATPPGCRRPPPTTYACWQFASPERRRGWRVDSHSDVYSLGVLMLEFWRRYILARDLRNATLEGQSGIVDTVTSTGVEEGSPGGINSLLDVALINRMLADDPVDRPDCFEIIDTLPDKID